MTTARLGSERAALWQARITCLSAFGPYIVGGARTEQIVVLILACGVLITGWPRMMTASSCPPVPFLVLWGMLYAVMLTATISRSLDLGFYGVQPITHALSWFLLPMALMLLTWYWTLSASATELARTVSTVIVGSMVVNTAVSLAQLASENPTVISFLPRFWEPDDGESSLSSVASAAAGNGRFTGIFNQPAEAGIAYGLALFCLVYLARRRAMTSPRLIAACGVAIATGGVLTLSKIFLLGAIPLSIMMILQTPGSRVRVGICVLCSVAGFWLLAVGGVLPSWPGGVAVVRNLAHPQTSLTVTYSAGRYGANGTLGHLVNDILRSSPVYGFGAGGLEVAYDSLWVEVLAVAGTAGAILMGCILLGLMYRWARLGSALGHSGWLLGGGALALAIGASLGIPSLTANRDSTLLWLIIGILIVAQPAISPEHVTAKNGRLTTITPHLDWKLSG